MEIGNLENLQTLSEKELQDIVGGVDVPAGPIWNNKDAQTKCPAVAAAAGGRWNGQWRTTIPGRASVCGVV